MLVYQFTMPAIMANRAERLENAILQVVPGSETYHTLYLMDGGLTATLPAGVDAKTVDKIYAAADVTDRLELDLFEGGHRWGGNKSVEFFRKHL